MKNYQASFIGNWLKPVLLAVAVLAAGCATQTKVPLYSNSQFNPEEVDCITVLPVVDLRHGARSKLDASAIVLGEVKSRLEKKNYRVVLNSNAQVVASLTEEDLDSDQAEWTRRIPVQESRWIMILSVRDLSKSLTPVGSRGSAEISGCLYDARSGTKLWEDSGIGRPFVGGLSVMEISMGMAYYGFADRDALNKAIANCMLSFPNW